MNQVPILNNRKTKQLEADVESVMATLPKLQASSFELLNSGNFAGNWTPLAQWLKAELRNLCPALGDWAEPWLDIAKDSIGVGIAPSAAWTMGGKELVDLEFIIWRRDLYNADNETYVPCVLLYVNGDWEHAESLRRRLKTPPGFIATYSDGTPDDVCPFWRPLPLAEFKKRGAFDLERFVITIRDAFEALAALRPIIDSFLEKHIATERVPALQKALILDVETWAWKGEIEIVEVGLIQVAYNSFSGELCGELDRYEGLRDPGPKTRTRTGGGWSMITPKMVAGKKLDTQKIEALIEGSKSIIAHFNCNDKKHFTSLFPSSKQKDWLCSGNGVYWKESGCGEEGLEYLCDHFGVVNRDAHRAMPDAEALLNVLAQKDGAVSRFAGLVRPTLKQSD